MDNDPTTSFLALTWNCEGFRRNIFSIQHFLSNLKPDLVFLSEPQIFAHDLDLVMTYLRGEYSCSLNSPDKYDLELPLTSCRAHGGTLVLWKTCHDPFISIPPPTSSSFLPVLFQPPGNPLSIHICVYLPTLGKESQFLDELAELSRRIDELTILHPESPIFLRGDFNVNDKIKSRNDLLDYFKDDQRLTEITISHPTYHHFKGNGSSDSHLDRIMFSNNLPHTEQLVSIICKHDNPLVASHHDIVLTSWSLTNLCEKAASEELVKAPKITNNRSKVIWTEEGIEAYQDLVAPHLHRLQELWLSTKSSKTSLSLLLESTNRILTTSASKSNKAIALSSRPSPKSKKIPPQVKLSSRRLLNLSKKLNQLLKHPDAYRSLKLEYRQARADHRKLVRQVKAMDASNRDTSLLANPSLTFKRIRASKRNNVGKINLLYVGDREYVGERVADGFYDSISQLKTRDPSKLESSPHFKSVASNFSNILELCKAGKLLPHISKEKSLQILQRMSPDVSDFFGLTPNHYNHAGPAGWDHFHRLLNALINDISSITIFEVNAVHACIYFKGHGKDKSSSRSYRTISTCPVVAKALDLFIRDLSLDTWNRDQAETQFQGEGSTHELAAVLMTETIQHSLYSLKEPVFILYLDAKSAFDVVIREFLIKNLFSLTDCCYQSVLYLNNRLENRKTFLDWNGQLMGPIDDEQGLEQGGVNSSDLYKIFGKEQLYTAQRSSLGVPLGSSCDDGGGRHEDSEGDSVTVSCVGQADDTCLISNNIYHLFYLLELTKIFCQKYQVELCADKTKLQAFATSNMEFVVEYAQHTHSLEINGAKLPFSQNAEHVGIMRSTSGNGPTILARFAAHRKALQGVLHTGLAKGHRANPSKSIKIDKMYAIPVLMSGLAPLVLSDQEIVMIEQHHKETLRCLLRLYPKTPRGVVYFLSGSLPGSALLHLRQLSLFGMISRLSGNILNRHARRIFASALLSPKSWFHQIRRWCLQYKLPHPLDLLENPPSKDAFKNLVKKKVVDYWETLLRVEVDQLSSLSFFKPGYMSLTSCHPIFASAGSSPSKVAMATVQATMISGRYRTEALCSHWTNRSGKCLLSEECMDQLEDIPHIITQCCALNPSRERLMDYTRKYSARLSPPLASLLLNLCSKTDKTLCNFLLDCSTLPEVISATQIHGPIVHEHLFNVTHTWIFVLHRDRLKKLGRWNLQ